MAKLNPFFFFAIELIILNETFLVELDFIVGGMLYRLQVTRPKFASLVIKDCFSRNLVLTLRRDFVALKEHDDDDNDDDRQGERRRGTSPSKNLSTRVKKKHFMLFDRR